MADELFDRFTKCAVEVLSVERRTDGPGFRVETSDGTIDAQFVVAATGPFQNPSIPPILPSDTGIHQLHSSDYHNPGQLPDGGPAGRREPRRDRCRGVGENADGPQVDVVERLAEPRVHVDAEQQHRRLERDGRDGAGRHRVVDPPPVHRDDDDTGGQSRDRCAVLVRIGRPHEVRI